MTPPLSAPPDDDGNDPSPRCPRGCSSTDSPSSDDRLGPKSYGPDNSSPFDESRSRRTSPCPNPEQSPRCPTPCESVHDTEGAGDLSTDTQTDDRGARLDRPVGGSGLSRKLTSWGGGTDLETGGLEDGGSKGPWTRTE